MVENFLTVGTQVLILFILIGIGVLCGKIRFFSPVTAKHLTNIVLYFVTPCVVVDAFHREFEPALLINLGITALCAVCIHILHSALRCCFSRQKRLPSLRIAFWRSLFQLRIYVNPSASGSFGRRRCFLRCSVCCNI